MTQKTAAEERVFSRRDGFTNVSDILKLNKLGIAWMTICLVLLVVCALALRKFRRLYPLAYFRFGAQEKQWPKLERNREFWRTVVVIGFIINVIAIIVLGFSAR